MLSISFTNWRAFRKEFRMIKEYTKKDGTKAYMFVAYLGVDSVTKKQKRTTRRGFKTKREARIAEAELQMEIKHKGFKTSKQKYTFHDVYALWIKQYKNKVKESTLNRVQNNFKSAILPHFENKDISLINFIHCQNIVDLWSQKYKIANALLSLTSEIFEYAIKLNIISSNPINLISSIRTENENPNEELLYYTKDELEKFLNACKDDLMVYTMFRILAFTGIRHGELLALQWSDIDFQNNTLSINCTLATGLNNKTIVQTPKTKSSFRVIKLDPITINTLINWRKEQQKILLKNGYNSLNNEQTVFSNIITNEYLPFHFLYLKRDTICKHHKLKKIKIHGFRHTHCSLLLAAGVPIQDVQKRLGHTDIKTTLSIYTHITNEQHEKSINTLMEYTKF